MVKKCMGVRHGGEAGKGLAEALDTLLGGMFPRTFLNLTPMKWHTEIDSNLAKY